MSTVFYSDGELVGLRNAIVRCLGVDVELATIVIGRLGEANREVYLNEYVLRSEPLEGHALIPSGPVDWTAEPVACWLDVPLHYPRTVNHLDGSVSISHFTLSDWIGNLLYNTVRSLPLREADHRAWMLATKGEAPKDLCAWAEMWKLMPEASLQGSAQVVPLPKKPSLRRRGKQGKWHGIPKMRTHTVETHRRGKCEVRLPGEITSVRSFGEALRYVLPGGWFIDDEGPKSGTRRSQRGPDYTRYSLHLSGAHKTGCAQTYERGNDLASIMEAYRQRTAMNITA